MWVEGAALLELPRMYGPGYAQFLHPFTLLWPQRPDLALFAGNVLVSALLPLLVLGVGRSLGLNRWKSLALALTAVLSPLFIRFSASEGYFSLILLFAIASLLAWMQAVPALRNRSFVKATLFALAGSLLASQGLRTHPTAWPAIAVELTVVSAHPAWKKWWHRILGVFAVGFVTLCVSFLVSGETLLFTLQQVTQDRGQGGYGLRWMLQFTLQHGLVAIVLLLAFLLNRRHRWLNLPALLALLFMVLLREQYHHSSVWKAHFEHLYFIWILIPVIASIPDRFQRTWTVPLPGVLVAALVMFQLGLDPFAPNTDELEYRFLAQELSKQPSTCGIANPNNHNRGVSNVPLYVSSDGHPRNDRFYFVNAPEDLDSLSQELPCVLYVESSFCSRNDFNLQPMCRQLATYPEMTVVAETTVPNRPTTTLYGYDKIDVPIRIYRLAGKQRVEGKGTNLESATGN